MTPPILPCRGGNKPRLLGREYGRDSPSYRRGQGRSLHIDAELDTQRGQAPLCCKTYHQGRPSDRFWISQSRCRDCRSLNRSPQKSQSPQWCQSQCFRQSMSRCLQRNLYRSMSRSQSMSRRWKIHWMSLLRTGSKYRPPHCRMYGHPSARHTDGST